MIAVTMPDRPKIYHIVHVDRLQSIMADGCLWCDARISKCPVLGTRIGMSHIKQRRLALKLSSHSNLHVGDCVPFYFCPRSIMLYLIYRGNDPELPYRGGQTEIVHLEADLHDSVAWAEQNQRRWAFTLSNAGANYVEDRCDLKQLNEIDWSSVKTNKWGGNGVTPTIKEHKQAEFLIEHKFPWNLIKRIGVNSREMYQRVMTIISPSNNYRPQVEIMPTWYY